MWALPLNTKEELLIVIYYVKHNKQIMHTIYHSFAIVQDVIVSLRLDIIYHNYLSLLKTISKDLFK